MSETTDRALNHEGRIARLEQIADDTRRILERFDGRFDRLESRIDRLEGRLDGRIDRFEDKLYSRFLWLLGIMLASFGGLLGAIARGFHWI